MVLFARKEKGEGKQGKKEGMRLGKYELGRTLGEGNFGKVKYAKDVDSGHPFAVKILEKTRIIDLKITDQIKREIGTLKLLKHPNVVQLHEVIASKTKIYMVLEYVNGGELFDRIASKGKLSEAEGRKLFQQLVDGVSYCHNKGVFHRDLKLENVLVDAKGNIKISDFGLSALPQHFRDDGLLHTTCGSPNYVAPEILQNRGYDGSTSDTWSCGVILYVILTGHLPFDDRNLAVLYQKIFKGEAQIPKWLSSGAKNLIRRILDPNPRTRLTMAEIKEDKWFKQDYIPTDPEEDEEDAFVDDEAFLIHEPPEVEKDPESPTIINAFQLIGMSSCLDLSGFFEKEDVSERKIRFTSNHSPKELIERIEDTVMQMGFGVLKKNGWMMVTTIIELVIDKLETKNMIIPVLPGVVNTVNNVKLYQLIPPSELKVIQQEHKGQKSMVNLSVAAKVFEISPSLYVVELRKSCGDSVVYRQLCTKLSHDLGVSRSQELLAMEF